MVGSWWRALFLSSERVTNREPTGLDADQRPLDLRAGFVSPNLRGGATDLRASRCWPMTGNEKTTGTAAGGFKRERAAKQAPAEYRRQIPPQVSLKKSALPVEIPLAGAQLAGR